MKLIDTHCHLAHGRLRRRLDEVLASAAEAGVVAMVCATGDVLEAKGALHLAQDHANVVMTVGVHPHDAKGFDDDTLRQVKELAQRDECVAVGEIGLDYHYDFSPRADQQASFAAQLEAAKQIGKPIVIHCREAMDDTLSILASADVEAIPVIFHSFTEGPHDARRVLDTGAMIGFSGIATFKKADNLRESVKLVPDDRILIETDSPYLTPEPVRKMKVNEPANVAHIAQRLAEVRGISVEAFAKLTTANAIRVFGLDMALQQS